MYEEDCCAGRCIFYVNHGFWRAEIWTDWLSTW